MTPEPKAFTDEDFAINWLKQRSLASRWARVVLELLRQKDVDNDSLRAKVDSLVPRAPDPEKERMREALEALLNNPHLNLGDLVYQVREREGLGWDGPAVKAWSEAVMKAKALAAGKEGNDGK